MELENFTFKRPNNEFKLIKYASCIDNDPYYKKCMHFRGHKSRVNITQDINPLGF